MHEKQPRFYFCAKIKGVLLALVFIGYCPTVIFGQNGNLSLLQVVTTPGDTVVMPLMVDTSLPISGIAFDLRFDTDLFEYAGVHLAEGPFNLYDRPDSKGCRFILLDPANGLKLGVGKSALFDLKLVMNPQTSRGQYDVNIENITITDGGVPPGRLTFTGNSGGIVVTENKLTISSAHWTASDTLVAYLTMANDVDVAGIQLRLKTNLHGGNIAQMASVNRALEWDLYHSSLDENEMQVVGIDLSGAHRIVAGDGPIMAMHLFMPPLSTPQDIPFVHVMDALVTNGEGEDVPVVVIAGDLDIDGRPDPLVFVAERDSVELENIETLGDSLSVTIQIGDGSDVDGNFDVEVVNEVEKLNRLSIGSSRWIGMDTLVAKIQLKNETDISGLQFKLQTSIQQLTICRVTTTGRAHNWTLFTDQHLSQEIQMIGIDLSGDNYIQTGEGEVFEIYVYVPLDFEATVIGEIKILDIISTDVSGGKVLCVGIDGPLDFGNRPILVVANPDTISEITEIEERELEDESIPTESTDENQGIDEDGIQNSSTDKDDDITNSDIETAGESDGLSGSPKSEGLDGTDDPVEQETPDETETPDESETPDETGEPDESETPDKSGEPDENLGIDDGDFLLDPMQPTVVDTVIVLEEQNESGASNHSNEKNVKIVEILADPPSGDAGDVNQDGVRNSREDEFVELLNVGNDPIDIGGWLLGDDDVRPDQMFSFPAGTILSPGKRVVVFGGGNTQSTKSNEFHGDGRLGNGLTNSGDVVLLLSADGRDTIDQVNHPGYSDQSALWLNGKWQPHKDGIRNMPFSPGYQRPVLEFAYPNPSKLEMYIGEKKQVHVFAHYSDGEAWEISKDEVLWAVADTTIIHLSLDGQIEALSEGYSDAWFAFRGGESLHTEITVLVPSVLDSVFVKEENGIEQPVVQTDWKMPNGLVISEIHANPAAGMSGDTNGDGARDTYGDEFIELSNQGEDVVELGKFYLGDDDVDFDRLFQFPDSVRIYPKEVVTLFGGGHPEGVSGRVFTDDGRIGDGLSNAGDRVRLIAPDGNTEIVSVDFGESPQGISWARGQDGNFQLYTALNPFEIRSPGRQNPRLIQLLLDYGEIKLPVKSNTSLVVWGIWDSGERNDVNEWVTWGFSNGGVVSVQNNHLIGVLEGETELKAEWQGVESNEIHVDVFSKMDQVGDSLVVNTDSETEKNILLEYAQEINGLVISEVYTSPASGSAGDANGDGHRDGYEDEFIELTNLGQESLDISGWYLGDDDVPVDRFFSFPNETVLLPGERLTLFGGGTPHNELGKTFVDDGRIGDGLSNSGEVIVLVAPDGVTKGLQMEIPKATTGVSFVSDKDGKLQLHNILPGIGQFSPGASQSVLSHLEILPSQLTLFKGETVDVQVRGGFSQGEQIVLLEGFEWFVFPDTLFTIENGRLHGRQLGTGVLQARFGMIESDKIPITVLLQSEHEEGKDSFGENVKLNTPPEFRSLPDSIAVIGLPFRYQPKVYDREDDPMEYNMANIPDWLVWDGVVLMGIPPKDGEKLFEFDISVTDGKLTIIQNVILSLRSTNEIIGALLTKPVQVGVTWKQPLALPVSVELQVDGGPEWDPASRILSWKPNATVLGTQQVIFGFGGENGKTEFEVLPIRVRPKPVLILKEIVVIPIKDINGDGTIDPFLDQALVIENKMTEPLDLSGWQVGDGEKNGVVLPEGTRLASGERFSLLGQCDTGLTNCFSAGGRIGNGLAMSDRILVIAPDGPDTLLNEKLKIDEAMEGRLVKNMAGEWVANVEDRARGSPQDTVISNGQQDTTNEAISITGNGSEGSLVPFPNPFNGHTIVGFYSTGGTMRLTIYNLIGQRIRRLVHQQLPVGYYQRMWNGTNDLGNLVGSGIYVIVVENRDAVYTQRVVLLR